MLPTTEISAEGGKEYTSYIILKLIPDFVMRTTMSIVKKNKISQCCYLTYNI
jgi:hypothetical protein